MVKFISVGGIAALLAGVNAEPNPGPEAPIPADVLAAIAASSNPEGSWKDNLPAVNHQPVQLVSGIAPVHTVLAAPQQQVVYQQPSTVVSVQRPPTVFVQQAPNTQIHYVQKPATGTVSNYLPYAPPAQYAGASSPEGLPANNEINFPTPNLPNPPLGSWVGPRPESGQPTPSFGNGFGNSRPEGIMGPSAPENGQDFEHSQMVNMGAPGVVEGTDVIKSIAYRSDGNYKLEINFKGVIPLTFVDLQAGKCSQFTPGVSIVNADNFDTTLEIDMAICQKECDLRAEDLLSSIDVLNEPIDITFGIQDPEDYNRVIGKYHIQPNAMYHEDYILEFNTETEETRQLVIDDSGNFFQVDDNIQFSYMTFNDDTFEEKTYSTKASAPPGYTTFIEMCPINGFTTGKMLNVPEICFIKDLTNDKTVMMWDMGIDDGCVANLHYETATGNWQYPANYYQIMGYSTRNMNHNNFKITCNMRVCGNVAGNACQMQIANCDYTK